MSNKIIVALLVTNDLSNPDYNWSCYEKTIWFNNEGKLSVYYNGIMNSTGAFDTTFDLPNDLILNDPRIKKEIILEENE